MGSNPWISWNGVKSPISTASFQDENSYLTHTLEFLKSWSEGQKTFQLQTSGSTGSPKTITVHRHQLTESAKGTINFLELEKGQTALICLNTRYIAGIMMLVRAIIAEMNIVLVEPSSSPLKDIKDPIHFTALVPLQVDSLLRSDLATLQSIGKIIIGGAPISPTLENKIGHSLNNCFHTFGMTETLSHIALRKVGQDKHYSTLKGITIGMDKDDCLTIDSNYFDHISTTDQIQILSPNQFIWLGRKDFVINSGGVKIHPEEVESALLQSIDNELSGQFIISKEPDETLGSRVVLLLEKINDANLISPHLSSLPKFSQPKKVYLVNALSKTETGKINRKKSELLERVLVHI